MNDQRPGLTAWLERRKQRRWGRAINQRALDYIDAAISGSHYAVSNPHA